MELEYLKWISTPEEIQELLNKFGATSLEEVFPPIGHVVSITLEELSRVGVKISLEEFLKGWNQYAGVGDGDYTKITISDFLRPIDLLGVFKLGLFLQELLIIHPETFWKIIKGANGGWLL